MDHVSGRPAATRSDVSSALRLTAIGGPTLLVNIGGVRVLVDPTFSPPGDYESGPGRFLAKLTGPALSVDEVGEIDVVLLSHDQHVDNLDPAGRELLSHVPLTLTTASAADRLGGSARAVPRWTHVDLARPDGGTVRVTAVPARHGPEGAEQVAGEVTGFVLSGTGVPTVYVSGDNASLEHVQEIARRFPDVDVSILFAGGAQSPKLLGDAYLTLSAEMAARAAAILRSPVVVPAHNEGWGHFTEGLAQTRRAFVDAGLAETLVVLDPGRETALPATPHHGDRFER